MTSRSMSTLSATRRRFTSFARSPSLLAIGLGCAAALLYMSLRSNSLDDFDSVSFALALRHFNLFVQQPQPPGYPVYVALGRLLLGVRADPRWVLVTLSALSGGVAVAACFGIGYLLSGGKRAVGLSAALLLAFMPVFWLTSEKALSDVPALAANLLAIFLMIFARERPTASWLMLAGLAGGVSLGFRPQNALALLPFALYLVLSLARRRCWREIGTLAATGLVGVVLWLIPVVQISLGPNLYLQLLRLQGRHVWQADSLFGMGPLSLSTVHIRLASFLLVLVQQMTGLDVPVHVPWAALVAVALVLSVGIGLLLYAERRRPLTWLVVAWLALGAVQNALLESLGSPRLMLLFIPAGVLLFALMLARLPRRVFLPALGVTSLLLIYTSWPLADLLATQETPPLQAAAYVRAHFAPADTLLLAAGSYRHVSYALPDYRVYYGYYLDRSALAADIASKRYRQVIVIDPEAFSGSTDLLGEGKLYLVTGDLAFSRDPRAHYGSSRVEALVLTRADLAPSGALLPPNDGRIEIGTPGDERYLGDGWFYRETVSGMPARWTNGMVTAKLRVHLAAATGGYTLRFSALGWLPGQTVTVGVDGTPMPPVVLREGWSTYELHIPAALFTAPTTEITLAHSTSASPAIQSHGTSSDQRRLAVAYAWFQFQPQ